MIFVFELDITFFILLDRYLISKVNTSSIWNYIPTLKVH